MLGFAGPKHPEEGTPPFKFRNEFAGARTKLLHSCQSTTNLSGLNQGRLLYPMQAVISKKSEDDFCES
jgi:hypothetical protein